MSSDLSVVYVPCVHASSQVRSGIGVVLRCGAWGTGDHASRSRRTSKNFPSLDSGAITTWEASLFEFGVSSLARSSTYRDKDRKMLIIRPNIAVSSLGIFSLKYTPFLARLAFGRFEFVGTSQHA